MLSRLLKPRNVRIIVGVAAGSVFCVNAVPLLFPEQTTGRLFHSYKDGNRSPLSAQCRKEFEQVCADLGVKNAKKYHVFCAFGTMIHTAGLPWLPNGVCFGIPDSFEMRTIEEITREMTIVGNKVDWRSDDGRALANSLLLSESAKKFYIARQLAEVKTSTALVPTVAGPSLILAAHFGSQVMKYAFVQIHPGFLTLSVAAVCGLAYLGVAGFVNNLVEEAADRRVARLSAEYARGGVEFYTKLLRKNKQLRKFMGRKGERLYSYYGNENLSALSFRHVITDRRRVVGEIHEQMSHLQGSEH